MRTEVTETCAAKRCRPQRWSWILLAILILFVAAIRIRLLHVPLERDEGEFAYMGQLMLQGIPPYLIAYNMKLPGIYAAYALLMAVWGQTTVGVHIGLLLVNAAAIVLIFVLTRRLYDSLAAIVAASAYALLSLSPSVLGTSAHATHFIVPLVLGGMILLLRAPDSGRYRTLFLSGLLFGMAFLMKQPAIFFIGFALLYLVGAAFRTRPLDIKRASSAAAFFLLAATIPFLLTCLLVYAAGSFHNFWFWTFRYASQYVSEVPLSRAAENFTLAASRVMQSWEGVWIIAGIGLTSIIWNRSARSKWPFLIGMTLFSLLSVSPGFHFRNHYFITLLPCIAILAGIGVSAGTQGLAERRGIRIARVFPVLIMAVALIYPVIQNRRFLFLADPQQASRILYGLSPFPESPEVAAYLRKHTDRNERIFIFGSEPQICFYADRKSATGYIYVYGLMEIQDYAAKMQAELIREIEAAKPRYAVLVNVTNSWTPNPNSDRTIFKWAESYFGASYRIVGLIDMLPDGSYKSYWDDEARSRSPQSETNLYIVERIRN